MKYYKKSSSGFFLIEAIIYLALFLIIVGGGLIAAYQVIQATDASHNHVILQGEANFLLRKIDWALQGAQSVNVKNTHTLEVVKGSLLTFTLNSGGLTLQRASNPPVIINSSNVAVTMVSFLKTPGSGVKPDSFKIEFNLSTAQNARPATQTFSTTKYLRQ